MLSLAAWPGQVNKTGLKTRVKSMNGEIRLY